VEKFTLIINIRFLKREAGARTLEEQKESPLFSGDNINVCCEEGEGKRRHSLVENEEEGNKGKLVKKKDIPRFARKKGGRLTIP